MFENVIEQYGLEENFIEINSQKFKYYAVGKIDALYNVLLNMPPESEAVKDERIPYWAELWHSAIALSTFLHEYNLTVLHKNVLELACGLALPSICASRFAKQIIVSDYMQEALQVAELNLRLNDVQNFSIKTIDWRNFSSESLDFEVLICSDIVYEKRAYVPVFNLFNNIVQSNKKIIFVEPNRLHSKDFISILQDLKTTVFTKNYLIDFKSLKVNVSVYAINFDKDELA